MDMKITYYGHSCLQLELSGKSILIDPFISPNENASHIDLKSIQPDTILITHGHQDHVADVVTIAQQSDARVIANFEVATWLQEQGVENSHPVNHGGTTAIDDDIRVKYVHAVHSSVLPDGTYGGNPGGFVISDGEKSFYHSGDTALSLDMKLIADEFSLSAAALCIGDNFTMGAADAARAAEFIQCDEIIGIHYDTFPPIQIDHEKARQEFSSRGRHLYLLDIGASKEF
jgi:L-ascorbate metabolism protein UlaG (beta-lactamase superfamily)